MRIVADLWRMSSRTHYWEDSNPWRFDHEEGTQPLSYDRCPTSTLVAESRESLKVSSREKLFQLKSETVFQSLNVFRLLRDKGSEEFSMKSFSVERTQMMPKAIMYSMATRFNGFEHAGRATIDLLVIWPNWFSTRRDNETFLDI